MRKKAAPKEKQSPQKYSAAEIEELRVLLENLRIKEFAIYQSDAAVWKRKLGKWACSKAGPLLKHMYLLEEAEIREPMLKKERDLHLRDIGNEIAIEFTANIFEYFRVLARYLKARKFHEVPNDMSPTNMGLPKKQGRGSQPDNLSVVFPVALINIVAQRIPGGVDWWPIPPTSTPSKAELDPTRDSIPTDVYDVHSHPALPLKARNPSRITRSELKDWVQMLQRETLPGVGQITESELSRQITKWRIGHLMEGAFNCAKRRKKS